MSCCSAPAQTLWNGERKQRRKKLSLKHFNSICVIVVPSSFQTIPFPVHVVSKMTCAATFRPAWAVKNNKYSHDLIRKTSSNHRSAAALKKGRERERKEGMRERSGATIGRNMRRRRRQKEKDGKSLSQLRW